MKSNLARYLKYSMENSLSVAGGTLSVMVPLMLSLIIFFL